MSAAGGAVVRPSRPGARAASGRERSVVARPWLPAAALLFGLAVIVGVRWWAARAGLDALAVGLAFGVALAGLAIVGRSSARASPAATAARASRRAAAIAVGLISPVAIGITFGLALVGLVAAGAALSGAAAAPGLGRPAAPFLPWAAITILVASAEEALLRGRLFDATRRPGGVLPAIAITTLAFAAMHVPLYGWHVVPLDLAVGLGLGGLRLVTGRVAAPAAAHTVADLATWWL